MATRLIDLPFTSGINESTDETVAQLPVMTELTNYRLTRAGRLEHRLGVQDVPLTNVVTGGSSSSPDLNKAQGIHDRTLLAGGHAFTALSVGEWACQGTVSRFVPHDSVSVLSQSAVSFTHQSCASVHGFLVVIGTDTGATFPRVQIRIIDEVTGANVWSGSVGFTSGGSPNNRGRVVACDTNAVIVFQDIDTGNIYGTTRDLAVLPFADFPTETLIVGASVSYGFDAAPVDTSRYIVATYRSTTGRIDLRLLDATTHATQAQIDFATGASYVTCLYYGDLYYLAWCDTAANVVRVAVYQNTGTFVQVGATQTVATGISGSYFRPVLCGDGSTTGVIVGYTEAFASTTVLAGVSYKTTFRRVTDASVIAGSSYPIENYWLASKPFVSTSTTFVGSLHQPCVWLANYVANAADTDRSYFLATIPFGAGAGAFAALPVFEASASPSQATPLPASDMWQPCEVVASSAGQRVWETAFLETFRGAGTANPQSRVQSYRFGDASNSMRARQRCVVDCQGSFAVLGGAPRFYDGSWMTEIGIPHGPTIIEHLPDTGGSMTSSATYRYVFVLEYYDAKGQRILSYPSSPYSVTMGASDGEVFFDVAVPKLWAAPNAALRDPRTSTVSLRAYRTSANVGTVFRFSPGGTYGTTAGPYGSSIIQYIDSNADTDIAANEAVYVQVGNALSNYRAPPCRFGCEHEGRLVVAGGWNPNEARVSKLFFPGEGIQFTESASFIISSPEPITGCASLDGSLVLFSARSVYTVTGDGPTDDGVGSFSTPRKLPGRIGCVDWRSVVTREDGVFFRSADGVYMLPRGLGSPVFVGSAIREKLRQYPETLGAATATRAVSPNVDDHDSEQVVAWLVGDAEEPTTVAIFMLSLSTNSWTQVSLPSSGGNPQVVLGVWRDITNSSDVLAFVREDLDSAVTGSILVENPGTNYDRDISGSFEPLLAGGWKTGKIFPFGFGGRGSIRSIRLVGDCLAATTLTPTIYSDDNPTGYTSGVLTFAAGRFAVEIPFRRRDLAWVQIQVADPTTGSGNRGAGLRFNGLALEVEMEGGLHRTAPNERST